jgi:hypothetical protein
MLKKEGMNVVEIKTALLGLFSKLFRRTACDNEAVDCAIRTAMNT